MERVFSKYSILRFRPDELRDESVNIGAVLFHDSETHFFFSTDDRKIQALAPGLKSSFLDDVKQTVVSLTNRFENAEQQRSAIEDLGSVVLSETAFIDVSNFHDVQSIGEHLLQTLVRPRRLKAQPVAHQLTLRASVEHYFFAQNLLGVKATDLAEHKVVKRFAIAGSEQLFADFAYRNGVMRFAQLLDLNVAKSSLSSKLEESCKKAVALDKAAKAYGVTARRFVLFRDGVDSDDNARAALNILRDYSDEQFDASSSKQLAEFYGQFAPPQLI